MIVLDLKSNKPIYEQIVEQMKFHVLKGHLKPGDAIPSVRKLALDIAITPGTVAKAYQELERQHFSSGINLYKLALVSNVIRKITSPLTAFFSSTHYDILRPFRLDRFSKHKLLSK